MLAATELIVIDARPGKNMLNSESTRGAWKWLLMAWLVVLVSGLGLRYGTAVMEKEFIRDNYLHVIPIQAIIDQGWSVETAIDYQSAKGPAFVWLYAAFGQIFGDDIQTMRLLSMLLFAIGALPVLLIARRCGLERWSLIATGVFWVLLPYNAPQGQMLATEVSFVCVGAWMMWAFLWGVGDEKYPGHRIAGPIATGVLLWVLLHNRPHAVALAGAVGMVSLFALGRGCWTWWLACFLAGLGRIPLYLRWGGIVPSSLQDHFVAFEFDPAGTTYLLAAVIPSLAVLVVPFLTSAKRARIGAGPWVERLPVVFWACSSNRIWQRPLPQT